MRTTAGHDSRHPARSGWRRATGAAGGIAVVGIALSLVLTACGGGKSGAASNAVASTTAAAAISSPAASGSGGANAAAFQKYTACLQQHGVTLPSFSPRAGASSRPQFSGSARPNFSGRPRPTGSFSGRAGGGGFGFLGSASANPSLQAAMQACASLRPSGAAGFGSGGGRAGTGTVSATTLKSFESCMGDNGVTVSGTDARTALSSLNRSDAKTAAALKICQPILGAAAGSGTPTPTPSAS